MLKLLFLIFSFTVSLRTVSAEEIQLNDKNCTCNCKFKLLCESYNRHYQSNFSEVIDFNFEKAVQNGVHTDGTGHCEKEKCLPTGKTSDGRNSYYISRCDDNKLCLPLSLDESGVKCNDTLLYNRESQTWTCNGHLRTTPPICPESQKMIKPKGLNVNEAISYRRSACDCNENPDKLQCDAFNSQGNLGRSGVIRLKALTNGVHTDGSGNCEEMCNPTGNNSDGTANYFLSRCDGNKLCLPEATNELGVKCTFAYNYDGHRKTWFCNGGVRAPPPICEMRNSMIQDPNLDERTANLNPFCECGNLTEKSECSAYNTAKDEMLKPIDLDKVTTNGIRLDNFSPCGEICMPRRSNKGAILPGSFLCNNISCLPRATNMHGEKCKDNYVYDKSRKSWFCNGNIRAAPPICQLNSLVAIVKNDKKINKKPTPTVSCDCTHSPSTSECQAFVNNARNLSVQKIDLQKAIDNGVLVDGSGPCQEKCQSTSQSEHGLETYVISRCNGKLCLPIATDELGNNCTSSYQYSSRPETWLCNTYINYNHARAPAPICHEASTILYKANEDASFLYRNPSCMCNQLTDRNECYAYNKYRDKTLHYSSVWKANENGVHLDGSGHCETKCLPTIKNGITSYRESYCDDNRACVRQGRDINDEICSRNYEYSERFKRFLCNNDVIAAPPICIATNTMIYMNPETEEALKPGVVFTRSYVGCDCSEESRDPIACKTFNAYEYLGTKQVDLRKAIENGVYIDGSGSCMELCRPTNQINGHNTYLLAECDNGKLCLPHKTDEMGVKCTSNYFYDAHQHSWSCNNKTRAPPPLCLRRSLLIFDRNAHEQRATLKASCNCETFTNKAECYAFNMYKDLSQLNSVNISKARDYGVLLDGSGHCETECIPSEEDSWIHATCDEKPCLHLATDLLGFTCSKDYGYDKFRGIWYCNSKRQQAPPPICEHSGLILKVHKITARPKADTSRGCICLEDSVECSAYRQKEADFTKREINLDKALQNGLRVDGSGHCEELCRPSGRDKTGVSTYFTARCDGKLCLPIATDETGKACLKNYDYNRNRRSWFCNDQIRAPPPLCQAGRSMLMDPKLDVILANRNPECICRIVKYNLECNGYNRNRDKQLAPINIGLANINGVRLDGQGHCEEKCTKVGSDSTTWDGAMCGVHHCLPRATDVTGKKCTSAINFDMERQIFTCNEDHQAPPPICERNSHVVSPTIIADIVKPVNPDNVTLSCCCESAINKVECQAFAGNLEQYQQDLNLSKAIKNGVRVDGSGHCEEECLPSGLLTLTRPTYVISRCDGKLCLPIATTEYGVPCTSEYRYNKVKKIWECNRDHARAPPPICHRRSVILRDLSLNVHEANRNPSCDCTKESDQLICSTFNMYRDHNMAYVDSDKAKSYGVRMDDYGNCEENCRVYSGEFGSTLYGNARCHQYRCLPLEIDIRGNKCTRDYKYNVTDQTWKCNNMTLTHAPVCGRRNLMVYMKSFDDKFSFDGQGSCDCSTHPNPAECIAFNQHEHMGVRRIDRSKAERNGLKGDGLGPCESKCLPTGVLNFRRKVFRFYPHSECENSRCYPIGRTEKNSICLQNYRFNSSLHMWFCNDNLKTTPPVCGDLMISPSIICDCSEEINHPKQCEAFNKYHKFETIAISLTAFRTNGLLRDGKGTCKTPCKEERIKNNNIYSHANLCDGKPCIPATICDKLFTYAKIGNRGSWKCGNNPIHSPICQSTEHIRRGPNQS